MLRNVPFKYRSRLSDIHLIVLSPASYVGTYGYGSILFPLIEDLKTMETYGTTVSFSDAEHHFKGTLPWLLQMIYQLMLLGDSSVIFLFFQHQERSAKSKKFGIKFCFKNKECI